MNKKDLSFITPVKNLEDILKMQIKDNKAKSVLTIEQLRKNAFTIETDNPRNIKRNRNTGK